MAARGGGIGWQPPAAAATVPVTMAAAAAAVAIPDIREADFLFSDKVVGSPTRKIIPVSSNS